MPVIKCLNSRIEANEKRRCAKFLAIAPQCVYDSLKSNPGEKLILRCPGCDSDVRWIAVYYDQGFVFETMVDKPVFDREMNFDRIDGIQKIA